MERVIITFLHGAKAGQTEIFPLSQLERLSMGRDPACDVRFDPQHDDLVSRHHATLEWDHVRPRVFVLTDLLSSNGTWRAGERLHEPVIVYSGEEIEFGRGGPRIRLYFEQFDPERVPPSRVTQTVPVVSDPVPGKR